MESFQVIKLADRKWNEIISECMLTDFHHTAAYHRLEKNENSYLFVASIGNDFVALPLILRAIGDTGYNDLTSVYGYCGPVSNRNFEILQPEIFRIFQKGLQNFFNENNVVTAFTRLHPLILGDNAFNGFGTIRVLNQTVGIDLRQTPEEQKRQYRKSNKSEINQLRGKKGYHVRVAANGEEIDEFVAIYHETMDRVNAHKSYYFDHEYFYKFLENPDFETRLLLAVKDEKIAAGAIFTMTKKIMQYHLAGTREEFISDTPMKIILDEARLLGNELKLEYLHLGGGVGGSDEDSLFRFKSGFSEKRFHYRVWQYVADEIKYAELCTQKLGTSIPETNFFPAYRSA